MKEREDLERGRSKQLNSTQSRVRESVCMAMDDISISNSPTSSLEKNKWWIVIVINKVIDVEEAKKQILFSLPMIIVTSCFYFINLVSVMFAGHLGKHELAASNLANSWAEVSGLSFMVGLSGGLETLCGQGYGAKMYKMLGIHLQTSCIISFLFSTTIAIIWWYSDTILILLHQDPDIAKEAGLFLKFLIPGLFAYGFLQNILTFLQAQSIIMPLVVCSIGSLVIHIGIVYVLVYWTSLGFRGAPLAVSISIWMSVLALGVYVLFSKRFSHIWGNGLSFEPFHYVIVNLKLALPSAAMVCLEYWAFELLVLLAGLMPKSETTTSLIAISVNTEAIACTISHGLSAAASTRVANELGGGNPDKAKHAMIVTLKLCVLLALTVDLTLFFGHNVWVDLFSDSTEIINEFATMMPLLLVTLVLDFLQGILSGVARGCGWQLLAMCINLATFYFIGMPIAGLLAFKFNLYAQGLWMGLICGLACQTLGLLLLTLLTRWEKVKASTKSDIENELQD